jgi:hypothetical protein
MSEQIKELSDIAYKNHLARNPNSSFGRRSDYDQEFAELIIDECCLKLLDMDQKVNGNHNYYKHAAIEIKRSFK